MDDREQKIRERAYAIWQSEGQSDGGHMDHWRRAEQEHDATDQQAADMEKIGNDAKEQITGDGKPAGGPEDRPPLLSSGAD